MATFYLLGAGASYAYAQSPTTERPPLARGLFSTFSKLEISGNIDVKVGTLINYVRDHYGVPYEEFWRFDIDAEDFMTELRRLIADQADAFTKKVATPEDHFKMIQLGGAYTQTLFLFSHILNEISNGPVSAEYAHLITRLRPGDAIATFNWDTLLDRALAASGTWSIEDGYGLRFTMIMRDEWERPSSRMHSPVKLLKLHGSTNWLVNWSTFDRGGNRQTMVPSSTTDAVFINVNLCYEQKPLRDLSQVKNLSKVVFEPVIDERPGIIWVPTAKAPVDVYGFESGRSRFDTWRDRYRPGYAAFTYFMPPNVPEHPIPMMPLLVALTREKEYDVYASVLEKLWDQARSEIQAASRIEIIGYSFPKTDERSRKLISAALTTNAQIVVVNPYPESVVEALQAVGFPEDRIEVIKLGLTEYLATG